MKKIFIILLAVMPLFATDGPSERLDLPPALQKSIIPPFEAKGKNPKSPLRIRDLQRLAKPNSERIALVFFATWCIPCKEGMLILKENKELLEKNNVQVVLVNVKETNVKKVDEWIEKYANSEWDLIRDPALQLVEAFGLLRKTEPEIVLPQTLLLNKNLKPLLLFGAEGNDWPQVLWLE